MILRMPNFVIKLFFVTFDDNVVTNFWAVLAKKMLQIRSELFRSAIKLLVNVVRLFVSFGFLK